MHAKAVKLNSTPPLVVNSCVVTTALLRTIGLSEPSIRKLSTSPPTRLVPEYVGYAMPVGMNSNATQLRLSPWPARRRFVLVNCDQFSISCSLPHREESRRALWQPCAR